jgi:hypothetical protein
VFKGNALYDVSLRLTAEKGYIKSIPGAPLCGCLEHMPVVEKADCRQATGSVTYVFSNDATTGEVSGTNEASVTYESCGDLQTEAISKHADKEAEIKNHLVGEGACYDDNTKYLNDAQFLVRDTHATKYQTITEEDGWTLVVGEGIRFMPPGIDSAAVDASFRALIDAGCKESDGVTVRPCLIRRFCDSCDESHRDIFYKRLTDIPDFEQLYFLDLFMNQWFNEPANNLNVNFELYFSYEQALNGEDRWTWCNYNDPGIGFPRDCGPTGRINHNWNSYVRNGGRANHHAFYVEKP